MINRLQNFENAFYQSSVKQVEKVRPLKVYNKILGELTTASKASSFNHNQITTEIRNRVGKLLGKEIFSLYDDQPISTGSLITIEPEYRRKGFRLGEILRLSSIIMMLENKIKEFEIYSKNTAIFFHSKYKFEPAISQFKERDEALESVIANCKNNGNKYNEIKEEAEELLEEAHVDKTPEKQRELCVLTNNLISRYIKKVLETNGEYHSHEFKTGIFMKLTDDSIIKNKEFFNALLEKHNIDYEI